MKKSWSPDSHPGLVSMALYVFSWFNKSYLSSRCFRTNLMWKWLVFLVHILLRCPQGSDLGPLLFGMYTTPLSTLIFSSLNHITSTYVDDTDQLFLSFHPTDFDCSIDHLHKVARFLFQRKCRPTINRRVQKRLDNWTISSFWNCVCEGGSWNGKSGAEAVFVYATKSQRATS